MSSCIFMYLHVSSFVTQARYRVLLHLKEVVEDVEVDGRLIPTKSEVHRSRSLHSLSLVSDHISWKLNTFRWFWLHQQSEFNHCLWSKCTHWYTTSSIEVLRWGFVFHQHGQQISQSRNGDRGKVVLWCHFASRTLFDHGSRSSMFILINCLWYHPLESCNNFLASWLAPAMLASYAIKSP